MNRFIALLLAAALVPACGKDSFSPHVDTARVASGSVDATGGTVAVADPGSPLFGTQVVIPAGALAASTTITIDQVVRGGPFPDDVLSFQFGPAGTTFAVPVTVTVKYSAEYLTRIGLADALQLRVVQRSTGRAPESPATVSQDTIQRTISVSAQHFSIFGALGYTAETAQGTYFMAGFSRALGTTQSDAPATGAALPDPRGFVALGGTITFNGHGGASVSEIDNTDGARTLGSGSGVYGVSPDGSFHVGSSTGGILAGGSVIVVSRMASGADPEVNVWIKKAGSFTKATVQGTYFVVAFRKLLGAAQSNAPAVGTPLPDPKGFRSIGAGTVTFDGLGGATFSASNNVDGTLSANASSATYSVAADGTFHLGALTGGVLEGGSMIVCSNTAVGGSPELTILLRQEGTFTTASVHGTYAMVGFSRKLGATQPLTPSAGTPLPDPLGFVGSGGGTVTFDGLGGATVDSFLNTDGVISADTGPATYSVAADGTLTFGTATGGVLADGSVIVVSTMTGGSDPEINLWIRK